MNKVMEDYTYSITKTGNKVYISGSVCIEQIDLEINHSKTLYLPENGKQDGLEKAISSFKKEFRDKVAEVVKVHSDELTDDEEMIKKLSFELKLANNKIRELEKRLYESLEEIEQGKSVRPYWPYPLTTPNTEPWDNPNPWSTGITWETQIGDPPGWKDKNNITCSTGDGNTSVTYGTGDEVRFNTSEHRKRNPKRFG